jgi:hypothetical protein
LEPHEYLAFRKKHGLTQVQAAAHFGVSLKTYRKYEKGYRPKPYPKDTILFDGQNWWRGGHRGTRKHAGYVRDPSEQRKLAGSMGAFLLKQLAIFLGLLLLVVAVSAIGG